MTLVTAITVRELSRREIVTDFAAGTAKRRYEIMFRGVVATGGNGTHDFRDQWPEVADIEGCNFLTVDSVPTATSNVEVSWTTTTAKVARTGAFEARFTVILT